jgi:hypothetical protein
MARFIAEVTSVRGAVTHRLGHTSVRVKAAGWRGGIEVRLYDKDGEDWAVVRFVTHRGAGSTDTIYDGPASGFAAARNAA